jgi:carbonic anhydrase/acetyltransferase-like protein (isoleucine patch superfamily)
LRGDHGTIIIEEGSAIEEGVLVHTSAGVVSRIGPRATVGHGAMLHSATVEEYAVIGMRATLANHAKVGRWSIVGEAGLVKAGDTVPPESIAVGHPVRVIGTIEDRHRRHWRAAKQRYVDFTGRNRKGLVKI